MAKVSIIIPVFNAERFLEECLESIQRQTLKDLEIICVDDGSTDSSTNVIKNFQKNDDRIRLMHQERQGSGAARNKALSIATGEYVIFLDADDFYVDPKALEKMYQACKEKNLKICGSFRRGLDNGVDSPFPLFRDELEGYKDGRLILYHDYQGDFYYHSFLFSLEMLKENNIVFPDYLRYQDPPFFVRAMYAAVEFYVVPVELYCYRFGHQIMQYDEKRMLHILFGIHDVMKFAMQHKLEKLYHQEIMRLEDDYNYEIIRNIRDGSIKVLRELIDIERDMDEYEDDENNEKKVKLVMLEHVMQSWPLYEREHQIRENLDNTKYWWFKVFTFPTGSRVAIYGAGDMGQDYYEQFDKNKDISQVYWFDSNYARYRSNGLNVLDARSVNDYNFDYMVIAVLKEETAEIIKNNLINIGISEKKILWQNNNIYKDKVYLCNSVN